MMLASESTATPESSGRRRVLVVDDDIELCALVSEFLRREGIDVEAVHDGEQGLRTALAGSHDAIILDVMLPGIAGFDVLRKLREQKRTPVLMLTARGDHVDRVVGLEMGADDYIPKPFDPRELVARIRAVLRRATASAGPAPNPDVIEVGELRVDLGSRDAWYAGRALRLTAVEFDLLVALMRSAGRYMTREQLAKIALGRDVDPLDRVIDVHISNLRRKLGSDEGASIIRTVRSSGYLLMRSGVVA